MIPRPHIANELSRFFLPEPETSQFMCFGVIICPSGSGKTQAIGELCSKFPEGILYYEITEPNGFVKIIKPGNEDETGTHHIPGLGVKLCIGVLLPLSCIAQST